MAEVPALLAALAGTAVVLGRQSGTRAASVFLVDGDSLTLPVLLRGAFSGHWHPVGSTQLMLFPELPLYALCAALTPSTAAALLLNAFVWAAVLYGLLRAVARSVGATPRAARGAALAAIAAYLLAAGFDGGRTADAALLTTYYDGALYGGLAMIVAVLRCRDAARAGRRRTAVGIAVFATVVGVAVVCSDGLYDLWVAAPLCAVAFMCWVTGALPRFEAELVVLSQLAIVAIGEAVRRVAFAWMVPAPEGHYVRLGEQATALRSLGAELDALWQRPAGRVEIVVAATLLASVVVALGCVARDRRTATTGTLAMVCGFAATAPASALLVVVLSGTAPARYFVPFVVDPLLSLVAVSVMVTPWVRQHRLPRWIRVGSLAALCAALVTVGIPGVARMTPARYADVDCVRNALSGRPAVGVSGYWTARALDVYGDPRERVLQVTPDLRPYKWLTDLGDYAGQTYTFVVVGGTANWVDPVQVGDALGAPASVTACRGGLAVWQYPAGSFGSNRLTADVEAGSGVSA